MMIDRDKRIGIGLIGVGWMGRHHALNILKNQHARLVAVSDIEGEKAREFVGSAGISAQVYTDYQDMLARPDVDAVVIASPNKAHAEHASAAAQAGKHIYLEKPMATTLEDCRRLARAVEQAGVKCNIGYHRRLNPIVQYAKRLQIEDRLGELVLAESDYVHYIPGDWNIWEWLGKESIAGSLIHAGAGHNVDLLRYFCGEVVEVSCFKDIRMPRKCQIETEDIAIINLRFANGALGRVVMFIGPIVPFSFTIKLFGTKGTVNNNRIWLDTTPEFDKPGNCITLPESWIPDNVQGGISETWDKSLETFIDDVRLDRQPFNDHISGFNTAAVCFAAVRSAIENRILAPETL